MFCLHRSYELVDYGSSVGPESGQIVAEFKQEICQVRIGLTKSAGFRLELGWVVQKSESVVGDI